MSNFYTILTDVGASAMAVAAANNTPLDLSEIALGDGNGSVPLPGPTSTLVNEVYRAPINSITQDPVNPAWYNIELILPPDVGGFWIRELAVYDGNGDTIYLGNHAPEYKPVLAEGSTRDTIIRVVVETGSAAEITLIVDPNIVTATHDYVLDQFSDHTSAADPHPQYALKTGVQSQQYTSFTTTGSAPDFIGAVSPAITAYAANQRFRVKFHANVVPVSTLNINGLGAKTIKQYDANGVKFNSAVAANQLVDLEYDGTDFVVLNPTTINRGALTKSVAGNSDVSLSAVESANEVIIFTGAITGNISVTVAKISRSWIIRNLTTGAFTVTFKTITGAGVVCRQGRNTHVFSDGDEIRESNAENGGISFPVRFATTANIANLPSGAPSTLDGLSLAKNDRILVKDQTTKTQNGIYIVDTVGTGANGVWVRAGDSDESPEIVPGMLVVVQEGNINQDTIWELATDAPITLGSTNLDFIIKDGNRIATIAGSTKNLVIKQSSPGQFTVTADEIVVKNAIGSSFLGVNVSETLNSAASGVNGLDTGALTATNWYYIWAISDGVVNTKLLLSLSNTNPTMPSGYTYKALIGCANRVSSNFLSFVQRGNYLRCYGSGWEIFQVTVANTLNASVPVPPLITKECVISIGYEGAVGEARLNILGDEPGALPMASITSINGDNQSIVRKDSMEFIYNPVTLGSLITYSLSHSTAGTTFSGRLSGIRI